MFLLQLLGHSFMLATDQGHLSGFDRFFYGQRTVLENFFVLFSSMSWQIKLCLCIIALCALISLFLALKLAWKAFCEHRSNKKYAIFRKKYQQTVYDILNCESLMSVNDIKDIFSKVKSEDGDIRLFVQLVAEVRWKFDDKAYLINMKPLCDALGITDYYEEQLIEHTDVFTNLQEIITLPLPLNHESVLSIYINHHDREISNLSRMCYIVSTHDDPYKYLQMVLNENKAKWNTLLLHRLFDWMRAQGRKMPKFLVLLKHTTNEESVSFLIQEIAKYGTREEKDTLSAYIVDNSLERRSAAFKALTELWATDPKDMAEARRLEDLVLDAYESQTEQQRQESLILLKTINSGRCIDRFEQAFNESAVVNTKVCAIECLMDYAGNAGIDRIIDILKKLKRKTQNADGYELAKIQADQQFVSQVISLHIMSNALSNPTDL